MPGTKFYDFLHLAKDIPPTTLPSVSCIINSPFSAGPFSCCYFYHL